MTETSAALPREEDSIPETEAIPEPEGETEIIVTDYSIGQDNVAPRYVLEFDFHQKVFSISALGIVGFTILALAWPTVISEALEKGLEAKTLGLQPWLSMVLAGGGLILALAAAVCKRLLALLGTVATDPFTASNTRRLRQIGWLILAMQPVGFFVGWVGTHLPPDHDYGDGFGVSFTSLLAALLSFVLAELFERGRAMRDDLEGTV